MAVCAGTVAVCLTSRSGPAVVAFSHSMRSIVSLDETPVKPAGHVDSYTPSLLHSIGRVRARARLGISGALPFRGEDLWTGYEFSWLNEAGKPLVAGLRLRVPCTSPNLVESKSMKLYLNGFAQTRFGSRGDVSAALEADLAAAFDAPVGIELVELGRLGGSTRLPGDSLDDLDVVIEDYERKPALLRLVECSEAGQGSAGAIRVSETWHTHLFRSRCPITGQPDWASMLVEYSGTPLEPRGLLKYLVSFRRHAAFHEDTVEQIFVDIMQRCRPAELTVYGRFLRRGGVDINPFRSTVESRAPDCRLSRQ